MFRYHSGPVNEFLVIMFRPIFLIEFKQIHSIYIKRVGGGMSAEDKNSEAFQKRPVIAVKLKMTFCLVPSSRLSFILVVAPCTGTMGKAMALRN